MVDRAKIVRMAKGGTKPMLIAHQLGIHANTVYSAISAARRNGEDIPHFTNHGTRKKMPEGPSPKHINVPVRLHSLLEREAERHQMTLTEMAQRLLENALLGKVESHD